MERGETRESMDGDNKNAYGERIIEAIHDNSEIRKSERPTGATLAYKLTAAHSTGGKHNTTPTTGEAEGGREAGKEAEDNLRESGENKNINKLPEEEDGTPTQELSPRIKSGMRREAGESVSAGEGGLSSTELCCTNPSQTSTPVSPATIYPKVKVRGDSNPKADERGDINMDLMGNKDGEG